MLRLPAPAGFGPADKVLRFSRTAVTDPPIMPSEFLYVRKGDYLVRLAYGAPTRSPVTATLIVDQYSGTLAGIIDVLQP